MGRYAARTRFVELRLDGRPHGVYVLMEKLELHDDRVDAGSRACSSGRSPGRLRRRARRSGTPVSGGPILFEDPERDDLGAARIRAVPPSVSAAERALYGRTAPETGWRAHLDEGAAVDFLLVNELFKNQDASTPART